MRSRGFAVLLVDMPGLGESPVLAGPDAERRWTAVFGWLANRDDLDATRCAAIGGSFGGYWAMKLAYTHRHRLACAVNWAAACTSRSRPSGRSDLATRPRTCWT